MVPGAVTALVVITTVGNEEQAMEIAEELVARRHAACVNIVPGLRSIYRWQGKICQDSELMLVIKTLDSELEAVRATILELHTYELPEILAFPGVRGEPRFYDWIGSCLDKQAEFSDDAEPRLGDDD
jgi:periplasmic divalent cation tolerance protein